MHKHDKILKRVLDKASGSFVRLALIADSSPDPMERMIARGVMEDGGPGSGNFGHSGRPGQVGGSGAGGGGGAGSGSGSSSGGSSVSKASSFSKKSVSERNEGLRNSFSAAANDRPKMKKLLDGMKPGTVMRTNERGYNLYTKQEDGSWAYQNAMTGKVEPVTTDRIYDDVQKYVNPKTGKHDPEGAIQGIATPKNGDAGRNAEWDARRALANLTPNAGDNYEGRRTNISEAVQNGQKRMGVDDFPAEKGNQSEAYTKTNIDQNGIIHSAGVPVGKLANGSGVTTINPKDIMTPNPDDRVYNTLSEFAMRNKDGNLVLTPEREKLHQDIIAETFEKASPVPAGEQKVFTMLGGGSAAGKGTIQKMMPNLFNQNSPVIDADEYKKRIPEYVDTAFSPQSKYAASLAHEESSALAKRAMQAAFANNFNCTLDGTGDGRIEGPGGLRDKIETAQANGYKVEGVYVTCPTELAVKRNEARSKTDEYNRLVQEGGVRSIHKKVSQAFPKVAPLMDHVVLYDTNQPNGKPPKKIAECWKGQQIQVYDSKLYRDFLDKAKE